MDIRVRAALYSIGFFVGVFVLALALNAIAPYIELWMISVFFIGLLFYTMYHLMLAKLKFDEDLGRLNKKNIDGD
jgi:hypothetical protein